MTQTVPTLPRPVPGRRRPVRDGLRFLTRFVRRPKAVGALLPSSRILAEELVGDLDVAPGDVVVEYGPGTGPVTAVVRERLPTGAHYLGIELDPRFHHMLSERYPDLPFHKGSAADIVDILSAEGLPPPRRIISGLPFASLPNEVQDDIITGTESALAEGGEFRTFQYVHAWRLPAARRFRARMSERFAVFERSRPILRNVPPAFVLRYRRA